MAGEVKAENRWRPPKGFGGLGFSDSEMGHSLESGAGYAWGVTKFFHVGSSDVFPNFL